MKQFNSIWIIWFIFVCIWNFGWPEVPPIADVVAAALLSILVFQYKNYKT